MGKKRLDLMLTEQGFFSSRRKAQGAIMTGRILVDGKKIDKAGTLVSPSTQITIIGEEPPYVSRGGLKLEKALAVFPISFEGKRVLDIGASTGGFTDCALQQGAARVIAVDVGYGQLAWQLRQDPRVKVLERTNVRHLTLEDIGGKPVDAVTVDVSFISLRLVLPVIAKLTSSKADLILLIKPQFEAGKEKVGKQGVVKDPVVHREVILAVMDYCRRAQLFIGGLDFSPITGPEGNIEYLLWATKETTHGQDWSELVQNIVEAAHLSL